MASSSRMAALLRSSGDDARDQVGKAQLDAMEACSANPGFDEHLDDMRRAPWPAVDRALHDGPPLMSGFLHGKTTEELPLLEPCEGWMAGAVGEEPIALLTESRRQRAPDDGREQH